MRGMSQRLPGLSAGRRLGVWLGLSRSHRRGDDAAPGSAGIVRRIAVRLIAVRCVPGSVPGQDRYSASIAALATPGCHSPVAHALARRTADVAGVVVGNARETALSTLDLAGAPRRFAGGAAVALATGKTW